MPLLLTPFHRDTNRLLMRDSTSMVPPSAAGRHSRRLGTSTPLPASRRGDGISNELILQPNSEMQKINAAVERAQEAEAQASS